jgi:hypothetical protein
MTSAAPVTAPHSNNPQKQQHANQPYQQPMAQAQAQGANAVQASSPPSKRDLRTWWKNFKIPSKHQEAQGTSALSASPRRSASFFVEHFGGQSDGDPRPCRDWSPQERLASETTDAHRDVPQASVEPEPPPVEHSPQPPRRERSANILSWLFGCCTLCPSYIKLRSRSDLTLAEPKTQGIFGVPLRQSITYANVAISLIDEDGKSYIYGYVPIVVAKCGVFLKEKGTSKPGPGWLPPKATAWALHAALQKSNTSLSYPY